MLQALRAPSARGFFTHLKDLADGKLKGYKQAKRWLELEESVDAPKQASKLWKAVTLAKNGTDMFLCDWRDFQREYYLGTLKGRRLE